MSDIISRPSLDQDLLAVLKFEGNVNDELGNYNGTMYGSLDWGTGLHGQGAYFDGVNDYVTFPTSLDFPYTHNNYSVSLWFKWVGTGTGGSGAEKLLDKTIIMHDWYIWIHRNATPPYPTYIGWSTYEGGGAGLALVDSTHETDGKWHHVVVTYDNYYGKLYHQGVLKAQGAMKKPNTGTCSMMISYTPSGDSNQRGKINCWVDNYTFWGKTITDQDVQWLYNNGAGVEYPYTKPLPAGYTSVEEALAQQELEWAVEESIEDEPLTSIVRKAINPKTVVLLDNTKESIVL